MTMPPRKPPHEENVDSWLMSYADMITLLMCFFIIFVSVSEPKKDKFSLITEGLANKFGSVNMSTPLQGIYSAIQASIENHQIFRDVAIQKGEKSIEMELASGTFFQPGSAEFAEGKLPILAEIATALKGGSFFEYRIVIEGHTSDKPVGTALFPSNWELSSARAARAARFFIEQGIAADRLIVVGFADTRPAVPNRDGAGTPIEENRLQNERLVIKFERGS
jgi:chemotaxis protein MotB